MINSIGSKLEFQVSNISQLLYWLTHDFVCFFDNQPNKKEFLRYKRSLQKRQEELKNLLIIFRPLFEEYLANVTSKTKKSYCKMVIEVSEWAINIALEKLMHSEFRETYDREFLSKEINLYQQIDVDLDPKSPVSIDMEINKLFGEWMQKHQKIIDMPDIASKENMKALINDEYGMAKSCLNLLDNALENLDYLEYLRNQAMKAELSLSNEEVKEFIKLEFNFWTEHFFQYKKFAEEMISINKNGTSIFFGDSDLNLISLFSDKLLIFGVIAGEEGAKISGINVNTHNFLSLDSEVVLKYKRPPNWYIELSGIR